MCLALKHVAGWLVLRASASELGSQTAFPYILVLAKCKTVSDSNDVTLYYVSLDSSMMISRPRLHFHLPLLATHSGPYGRERKHCKARKEASNWAGRW
jgi:hypothetical protein